VADLHRNRFHLHLCLPASALTHPGCGGDVCAQRAAHRLDDRPDSPAGIRREMLVDEELADSFSKVLIN